MFLRQRESPGAGTDAGDAAILPDRQEAVKPRAGARGRLPDLRSRPAILDSMRGHEPIDVLVVAPVPDFDRASGSLRFYSMLRMLARRYRVTLLGWVDVADTRSPRYVHFLRELRGARYSANPRRATLKAWRTKRRELGVYAQADLVLTVTENDRAEILGELPNARVALIPNIHEARNTAPALAERRPRSLLFVGGFAHPPNVDAMLFFCHDILDLVRRRLGQVELTIVGAQPPREIAALAGDGVVIAGWVPDLTPYLDSHCVGIAPLRFGAGMKGKIGQSLASGLPVVTTTVGAEGMDLEDGKTALIADSPAAFAEAVVRLCTDAQLHRDLSEAGRSHVRRRWDVAASNLGFSRPSRAFEARARDS